HSAVEEAKGFYDCPCSQAGQVAVELECGLLSMASPYLPPDATGCILDKPYAVAYECKGTHWSLQVYACAGEGLWPCLHIGVSTWPDGESSEGQLIDGSGNLWTLTDIQMPDALPWEGSSAKGSFSAVATGADGAQLTLKGSYDVCIADAAICPI